MRGDFYFTFKLNKIVIKFLFKLLKFVYDNGRYLAFYTPVGTKKFVDVLSYPYRAAGVNKKTLCIQPSVVREPQAHLLQQKPSCLSGYRLSIFYRI